MSLSRQSANPHLFCLTPQHHLWQEEGPGKMVLAAHHTAKLHWLHNQHNLRQKLATNISNMVILMATDKKMVDDVEQKLNAEVNEIEKEFKRGLEKLNDKLTLSIEDVQTRCCWRVLCNTQNTCSAW
jgi:hypothetical protein